jgi:hypothetical protein
LRVSGRRQGDAEEEEEMVRFHPTHPNTLPFVGDAGPFIGPKGSFRRQALSGTPLAGQPAGSRTRYYG